MAQPHPMPTRAWDEVKSCLALPNLQLKGAMGGPLGNWKIPESQRCDFQRNLSGFRLRGTSIYVHIVGTYVHFRKHLWKDMEKCHF